MFAIITRSDALIHSSIHLSYISNDWKCYYISSSRHYNYFIRCSSIGTINLSLTSVVNANVGAKNNILTVVSSTHSSLYIAKTRLLSVYPSQVSSANRYRRCLTFQPVAFIAPRILILGKRHYKRRAGCDGRASRRPHSNSPAVPSCFRNRTFYRIRSRSVLSNVPRICTINREKFRSDVKKAERK